VDGIVFERHLKERLPQGLAASCAGICGSFMAQNPKRLSEIFVCWISARIFVHFLTNFRSRHKLCIFLCALHISIFNLMVMYSVFS
jgi:hypothetical protein